MILQQRIQKDVKNKQNLLLTRQKYIVSNLNDDINASTFEGNMINDLLISTNLKTEIQTLESVLNLIKMLDQSETND